MKHYGLPEKYIRIFQAFFNGTMSAVRVNGEITDWFTVNSGTGRGDIQGPPVFNFCLNLWPIQTRPPVAELFYSKTLKELKKE